MNGQDLLRSYSKGALVAMAEVRGLDADRKKDDLVQDLAGALFNPEAVAWALEQLSPLGRELLDRLLLRGGRAETNLLQAELAGEGKVKAADPSRSRRDWRYRSQVRPHRDSREFDEVVAYLTSLGLVFSVPRERPFGGVSELCPGEVIFVPDEVRRHLPQVRLSLKQAVLPEGTVVQEGMGERLLRDSYLYWSGLRDAPVFLSARYLVPKRDLRRLNDLLLQKESLEGVSSEEDAARLHFLRLTLQAAGWLRTEGSRLVAAPEAEATFRSSTFRRISRFFEAWLQGNYWNELLRLRGLYSGEVSIDTSRNRERRAAPSVVKARGFVVDLLRYLPPEAWVATSELCRLARIVDYGFLFPRQWGYRGVQNPYTSYTNPLSWDFSIGDEAEGWEQVERRFIQAVLWEPLHWLGIVSLGLVGGELVAFQLTRLGAQILSGKPPAEEEAVQKGQLIVQPDYQILVFEPVQDHVLAMLDRFAERVGADRVFEYRLTRASVYRAQQGGMSVEEILRFLNEEGSKEVPQNVAYSLAEWADQYERIALRPRVSLCQVSDPSLLDELLVDPAASQWVSKRLSPTVALVHNGASALLASHFVQRGYLPNILAADQTVSGAEIDVAADGSIRFTVPVPSLYLMYHLARFTEPDEERGGRRLSRSAVAQAAREGMKAEEMLRCLEAHSGRPLPAEVVASIKAWAHHYGSARVLQATLVQLEDDDVLRELEADPDLAPYWQRFVPQGPVLRLDPAHAAEVVHRLREKGVKVEE